MILNEKTDIKGLSDAALVRALSLEFGPSGCEDRVRDKKNTSESLSINCAKSKCRSDK